MQETWADTMSEKIGLVVNLDRLHVIDQVVEEAMAQFTPKKLKELRDTYVANFGNSAVAIVAYLNQQTELLSMTTRERTLKHQVDTLRNEMNDLRRQLS